MAFFVGLVVGVVLTVGAGWLFVWVLGDDVDFDGSQS